MYVKNLVTVYLNSNYTFLDKCHKRNLTLRLSSVFIAYIFRCRFVIDHSISYVND